MHEPGEPSAVERPRLFGSHYWKKAGLYRRASLGRVLGLFAVADGACG